MLLEARMRQNQRKVNLYIIQRGREMEHMEKEDVLTRSAAQDSDSKRAEYHDT